MGFNHLKSGKLGIIFALILGSPLKANASSFNDFVFFGDSITDSGNVFFVTGGETVEPPFGGLLPQRAYSSRNFSNDLVWSQYISEFNGLEINASFNPITPGNNFAFGGATNQPLAVVPSPSLEEQLGFWQQTTGNIADPDAFYFVQGGANDVRIATTIENDFAANLLLQNAVNSIDTIVNDLIDAGARNIAVINSPDIGLTPESLLSETSDRATNFSQIYNNSLAQTLNSFDSEAVNLVPIDAFNFIRSITNDPTAFDLPANTITNLPCILPNSVCSNPDEYIFYDGIHPTSATHFEFAKFIDRQIQESPQSTPEPSTLVIGFGFAFILALGKRNSVKN